MTASRRFLLSALCVLPSAVFAQAPAKAQWEMSIKNIMRGPEHYGREPNTIRWSADGQWIYFNWLPAGSDWRDTPRPYRVRAQAGSTPEAVAPAEMDRLEPTLADGPASKDGTRKLTQARGDLWLVDIRSGTPRRLTQTLSAETGAQFSSDGRTVMYVRDGNAYSIDLTSGDTKQLTDIRAGGDAGAAAPAAGGGGRGGRGGGGAPPPVQGGAQAGRGGAAGGRGGNPQRTTMETEQRQLFQVFRDAARADSIRRANPARDDMDMPRTVTLGAGERPAQITVSPSGGAVLFTTAFGGGDSRATIVPNYVTSSGYTEDIGGRTNVGDAQATAGRMGFMTLPRGEVVWLSALPAGSTAASQNVAGWNEDGSTAIIVAGSRDFKTRQYSVVDGKTGAIKPVEVMRDTAWVGGPCGQCVGWYDGGRRMYWVSETNGFAQLHSAAADGSGRTELTGLGKWEIYDVNLSRDGKSFFFHSSETSHFDRDLWSVPIGGGTRSRHTVGTGNHQAVLSPDENRIADVHSTNAKPPELFVASICAGAAACERTQPAKLTTSTSDAFRSYNWRDLEIVNIPASDGVQVPAQIYKPQDFGAKPNGAAVMFVHGAGYLHNVGHFWKGSYAREYMFNHLLASRGYYVLDVDYRASAGYGRDWRTAIYRWMGGRDLGDYVDASKWMTRTYGVNPERIGMYGGSYGGFMTLMALFTAPKYFGSGAALRSVTDWAHYNHGYTGPILNLPQDDTLSYHRSSPIFLAEGLEDPLLMLHGMVDTNVHFQDIVRLTQRLIELGKTDWWLAPYPVEDHGFSRPDSWTDEYRRIFEHFESTIGPRGSKVVKR